MASMRCASSTWQSSPGRSGQQVPRAAIKPFLAAQCCPRQAHRLHRASPLFAQGQDFEASTEPKTGIQFPKTLEAWGAETETLRLLGTGCREKKVVVFGVKVYAIAAYVEGAKAARELGVRSRGGFFVSGADGEYTSAVMDGAFKKMLVVQLVREVEGQQFVEALEEALEPRMAISGELSVLEDFKTFFLGKVLEDGTQVVILWDPATSVLQLKVMNSSSRDISKVLPDKEISSASLCRALFEIWLGDNAVIPDAKASFAEGIKSLLESDTQERNEFKPGGRGTDI